jgi:energy-coupling factor transporter transmembrane protein EcfT
MYWSHCAVTLSSLVLLFFFFVAIVALFFLTDIIFHFCAVCVQWLLLLFLLLFDVTGVGLRCLLLPDINTTARYCWHEKPRWNLSLRWKGHFPYLTRFCWIPGNSREVTGTDSFIENAHFLSALRKSLNEYGVWKVTYGTKC